MYLLTSLCSTRHKSDCKRRLQLWELALSSLTGKTISISCLRLQKQLLTEYGGKVLHRTSKNSWILKSNAAKYAKIGIQSI